MWCLFLGVRVIGVRERRKEELLTWKLLLTWYLTSRVCIIYKINPDLPVSSLCWMSSKDRHLHSFLVILARASKRRDLNVFPQRRQCHFYVVMLVFHFSIRVDLLYTPPVCCLLDPPLIWFSKGRHLTWIFHLLPGVIKQQCSITVGGGGDMPSRILYLLLIWKTLEWSSSFSGSNKTEIS